jgi:hypothetical protein
MVENAPANAGPEATRSRAVPSGMTLSFQGSEIGVLVGSPVVLGNSENYTPFRHLFFDFRTPLTMCVSSAKGETT